MSVSITITGIVRDARTGRISVSVAPNQTIEFPDIDWLRSWASREDGKRCDDAMRAAMRDVLASDPSLSRLGDVAGVTFEIASGVSRIGGAGA